jgi:hypothetical protein
VQNEAVVLDGPLVNPNSGQNEVWLEGRRATSWSSPGLTAEHAAAAALTVR